MLLFYKACARVWTQIQINDLIMSYLLHIQLLQLFSSVKLVSGTQCKLIMKSVKT